MKKILLPILILLATLKMVGCNKATKMTNEELKEELKDVTLIQDQPKEVKIENEIKSALMTIEINSNWIYSENKVYGNEFASTPSIFGIQKIRLVTYQIDSDKVYTNIDGSSEEITGIKNGKYILSPESEILARQDDDLIEKLME